MRSATTRGGIRLGLALCGGLCLVAGTERLARANGFEIPENGTDVMGRAGAWVARADNPMAGALNPAGLAGQPTALLVDANLIWQKFCFARAGNYASAASTSGTNFDSSYPGQPYPEVCKKNGLGNVNVVPQLMFNYHVNDRLGVALGVVTPSAAGNSEWPDQVTLPDGSLAPAPQRYMLLKSSGVVISPTLAAGYEVAKGVRFGVAFQATMAFLKFSNVSRSTYSTPNDVAESPNGDLRADLSVKKLFTPAIVLGALVSPVPEVDLGASFRYSADIRGTGDVDIQGPYYGDQRSAKNTPAPSHGTLGEFRAPQPWEARLGVRFHPVRKGVVVDPTQTAWRDFLANDAYDVELDGTYAHNSSFDTLTILFPPNQCVALGNTSCPNHIPPDTSIPHQFRDTFGVRLGGEYVAIPDKLGLRVGGFVQGNGQDPQYLALDFLPSSMWGLYAGGTLRLGKAVDLSAGFGHIWLHGLDNNGTGKVRALTAVDSSTAVACADGNKPPDFRTCNAINGGKVTGGYNMVSLGATIRL